VKEILVLQETETDTTGNTNSEQNYCVLMYLYRNNVTVWQSVASQQNHTCVWNTTKVCTFTKLSVQTGVRLDANT
jgi:hypothetical protein